MFEATAPSTLRALAELAIPRVRQKLDELAVRLTGSETDADELVASALALVCDPARSPWDGSGEFTRHMALAMRDLWIAEHSRVHLGLALRASLAADDPVALKVYDATCRGLEAPAEIAEALRAPVKEVDKALRRIVYRAARIKEKDDAALAKRRKPRSVIGIGRPRTGQDRS
jgi:DNA-directed RNA polymerase specialized sigma24 family protein